MTDQVLLDRARAGDEAAFAGLVQPHRRELHVHCYRMLGSFDDADDALQDTLLAAWRGLAGYTPAPTGSTEVTWLQPYPDALLEGLPDDQAGPDVRVEQHEAVSLAFITALQLLSPRARAVLILRDVLGFSAREAAQALGSTTEAVAMTLSRARAVLRQRAPAPEPDPAAPTPAQARLVRQLTDALTAHDVDAVVALLARDIRITMPPLPAVWQGRRDAARFLVEVAFRLVPQARFVVTRANGQPALAVYTRDDANGLWRAGGLLVLTVHGDQITGLTRFESTTLRSFDLPRILPGE